MRRISTLALLISVALISSTSAGAQTRLKPLAAGDTAPDFTLVDQHGKKVTLSDSKDRSPVVLVFYRGYW
jgi:cytochrome oxidase Cu insertion factor (SCO1/SenC/PrrC family)